MKSFKPGRGPSFMGGVMSLLVGLFGIVWTVIAATMGGGIFALFGLIFVAVAVVQAIYHFKNATEKNRYSVFDITEGNEEPDPLNERFGKEHSTAEGESREGSVFCPYCGNQVKDNYEFCNKCGKKLP